MVLVAAGVNASVVLLDVELPVGLEFAVGGHGS